MPQRSAQRVASDIRRILHGIEPQHILKMAMKGGFVALHYISEHTCLDGWSHRVSVGAKTVC
jgi:hypothetical protein